MNKNDNYVQVCVGCCQLNSQNRRTLPFMCPATNMPCFAISPDYLIPKVSQELISYMDGFNPEYETLSDLRMPIDCKYIDQNFVKTRCDAFDDLAKRGNKTIYTMTAY